MPRRSSKSRKKAYKSRKFYSNLRRLGLIFFITFLSLTFLVSINYINQASQSLVSASDESLNTSYIINKDIFTIALIEVSDINSAKSKIIDLKLYTFDKKQPKLNIYTLDVNSEVEVMGKYGQEPLYNILSMGSLSDTTSTKNALIAGNSLLINSLKFTLGHNIDNFIIVDSKKAQIVGDSLKQPTTFKFVGLMRDFNELTSSIITNLTSQELRYLAKIGDSLKINSINEVNIASLEYSNLENYSESIKTFTFDSNIALENKSVSILNGTNLNGLASVVSQQLDKTNIRVISSANASRIYEDSILIVEDPESHTAKYIAELLNIDTLLSSHSYNAAEEVVSRSDITVIIGLDIANNL